jgi:hypothetical protein
VGNVTAEHAWITNSWGNNCSFLGSPYINNCKFDAAQSLLTHLYSSPLMSPISSNPANVLDFEQRYYTPFPFSPSDLSMAPKGVVYAPSSCRAGRVCALMVLFHGCKQTTDLIGNTFYMHAGMNEWAESNNIVLLYPQIQTSPVLPYNPLGCWDWWGYTGSAYATQLGPQMRTVKNMMDALLGG